MRSQWQLRLLTLRAVVRPTLRHDDPFDGRSALQAWLPLAPVDTVQELKLAGIAVGVDVIRDRRSPVLDRKLNDVAHRLVEPGGAGRAQPRCERQRSNARGKQSLIHIDV